MSKNLKEKNRKTLVITYDQLCQRLSEISLGLPNMEKVMPKLKEYFRWTRENYNQMDEEAKNAVGAVPHLEVEIWVAKIFTKDQRPE